MPYIASAYILDARNVRLATIYSLRDAFRRIGSRERPPRGGSRLLRHPSADITKNYKKMFFFRRLYVTCFIGRINSRRILALKFRLIIPGMATPFEGVEGRHPPGRKAEESRIGEAPADGSARSRVGRRRRGGDRIFGLIGRLCAASTKPRASYNLPYDAHYR